MRKQIIDKVNKINWWHSIDLGNGIITKGRSNNVELLKKIQLPSDLSGMSILDIGAWDGYFSFEAEKRGAEKVVAIDTWKEESVNKDGFDIAKKILNSNVKDITMSVYDISPDNIGKFDIVLFLGVFYHLKYPLLALEKISSVTKGLLILETEVELINRKKPMMVFYPGNELNRDDTSWWAPNPYGLEEMLKSVGYKHVSVISRESKLNRVLRFGYHMIKEGSPFFVNIKRNRMVYHGVK